MPVKDRGQGAAGFETVGFGEGLADRELAACGAPERQAARAHVGPVEDGLAAFRERVDQADGGFGETGDVERNLNSDTGLHGGDAGNGDELFADGVGGAFQPGEDFAKTVFAVVGVAGRIERQDE